MGGTVRVGSSWRTGGTMRVGSSSVTGSLEPPCSRLDRVFWSRMRSEPHSLHHTPSSSRGWKAPQAQYQPSSSTWGTTVRPSLWVRSHSFAASSAGSFLGGARRTRG